jgi:hypothetical protein
MPGNFGLCFDIPKYSQEAIKRKTNTNINYQLSIDVELLNNLNNEKL